MREAVYIVDHLRLVYEFIPRDIEILGVTGNRSTKEKPSVSSSKKGKTKVSEGNKRPQKKKNKRTSNDQSPAMENSRVQSSIEVSFNRAHYDCPTQFDDSNVGDGTGFEDLPIMDLDTFAGQGTLNQ